MHVGVQRHERAALQQEDSGLDEGLRRHRVSRRTTQHLAKRRRLAEQAECLRVAQVARNAAECGLQRALDTGRRLERRVGRDAEDARRRESGHDERTAVMLQMKRAREERGQRDCGAPCACALGVGIPCE